MVTGMGLTRCYRDGRLIDEDFPVAQVSDYLEQDDTVVWFDLLQPTEEDLAALSEELGLHPLAVEDAVHPHQRPKLDHYASHQFLTAYSAKLNDATGELETNEVAAFILPRALVTVRKDDGFDMKDVIARWDAADQHLMASGVPFLLYGLVDHIVDSHFDVMQRLDTDLDALEESLFSDQIKDKQVQRRTYELRKSLVMMRRVVEPMREVVSTLMRPDLHIIDQETTPYFQDVYDHVLRATEWTDSLRDLVGNIHETHLTVRSNRLNVITKQVTSWAAIIAVPTAITGFYGQNVPYPGFGQHWGFWVSSSVTIVLAVILYIAFRRRDWL